MNKIKTLSNYVLYCLNFIIIAIPAIIIMANIEPFKSLIIADSLLMNAATVSSDYTNFSTTPWNSTSGIISLTAYIINLAPMFIGLFFLRKIFLNYKIGEVFNVANSKYYNYLGWAFFLDALLAKPINGILTTLASTLSNPVGERYITISFGTPNLEALFYGLLIIVIAKVMLEASKIQEEQQYIV